jgi:hypothetical protein
MKGMTQERNRHKSIVTQTMQKLITLKGESSTNWLKKDRLFICLADWKTLEAEIHLWQKTDDENCSYEESIFWMTSKVLLRMMHPYSLAGIETYKLLIPNYIGKVSL